MFDNAKATAAMISDQLLYIRALTEIGGIEAQRSGCTNAFAIAKHFLVQERDGVQVAHALCDIVIAEAEAGLEYADTLRAVTTLLNKTADAALSMYYFATLAKIGQRTIENLAKANLYAGRIQLRNDRDNAFGFIARTEVELGERIAAHETIERIEVTGTKIHAYGELAIAEFETGKKCSTCIATAEELIASINELREQGEYYCFIAVAKGLTREDPERMLEQVQGIINDVASDERDSLECQLAAAEAQLGRLEQASARAKKIVDGACREAAMQTIVTELAKRGDIISAKQAALQIERAAFRNAALRKIAVAQAKLE